MADKIGPDPGFTFARGAERGGKEWITELIRIVERDATTELAGRSKKSAAVADLNQTIAGPSIAEVQAISDKMDELLAKMRTAGLLES